MLPVLYGEDAGAGRALRFRWSPEAQLAVRLLGPDPEGTP